MIKMTLIAAADPNWGIGFNNRLPWHIPEDLKRFKARTMGKTVVMGRKTVASLPSVLQGRYIITMSRRPVPGISHDLPSLKRLLDGVDEEVFVAGGAEVYRSLLPHCDSAEITRVGTVHQCDTHMVDLSQHGWVLDRSEPLADNVTVEYWKPGK
jgi:dihydrofolate reductase